QKGDWVGRSPPFSLWFWHCPASLCNEREQYFGDGTKLTVLEDGFKITPPRVAIFSPSKQEIKEKKKATLVCLARGFYPDHVNLTWWVNGARRTEGVKTDDYSKRDDKAKSYSLTSRLRITDQEWFNSRNHFKCHVDFHGDKIQTFDDAINGAEGCSITPESYLRQTNATKFTYRMLLFKALLYALLVSALMWKAKTGDKLSRE
uniref:Ig-like domain-containing protein n=1 Tax=Sphenodon punctatus TaxID=8508 RepID=A0A8D0G7S5_SPHPU